MIQLNEQQRKAAEFEGKHLLVLAGAGTGKTGTIIARADHLLRKGVQPNRIAILSFTRKSAREIAERLKLSAPGGINKKEITGRTFHSWCNEIMHLYPDHFPHHGYTPLDEDDRLSAMALALGKNFRDSKKEKVKKEVVTAIYSYAVNTLCSLSDAILHIRYGNLEKDDEQVKQYVEEDRKLIAPVIKKYIDYKKERRYIDYDDMLSVVATQLERNEALCIVANNYDEIAWIRFLQLWDGIGEIKASRIISKVITLANFGEMIACLQQFEGMEVNAAIPTTLAAVREYNDRPAQAMEAAVKAMQPLLEKKYREEWTSRASDFEVLREVARSSGSITEFITEYVLDPKAETTYKIGAKETDDAVVLSTIHSAKGLEAEIVHILNLNPASFPSSRTILQGEEAIEEERRCLYVALTRAKNRLNLYRNVRSLHTQYSDANRHEQLYFLNNLPPHLVKILVNGQEKKDFPLPFNSRQAEADFPDFDFG